MQDQAKPESKAAQENSKSTWGLIWIFLKIFIARFASSGALKKCLMSMVRIAQAYSLSRPVVEKVPTGFEKIWTWAVDLFGDMRDWFGLNGVVTDELALLFSTVSISICIFSLIFSFHVGMKGMVRLLGSLFFVTPLFIALGCVPDNVQVMKVIGIIYAVIVPLFSLMFWCEATSRCYAPSLGRLWQEFLYPFRVMRTYCALGDDGVRLPEKKKVMIPAHFLLAVWWIIFTMIAFSYEKFTGFLLVVLVILVITVLLIVALGVLRTSKRDIESLVDTVYYIYMDLIYSSAIDQLGAYWKTAENVSWGLSAYAVLFCVILPLTHKGLFTYQAGRISKSLPEYDYYDVIDSSSTGYASLCSGIKPARFWWPVTETAIRIAYSISSVAGSDVFILITSALFIIGLAVARPYREISSFVIGLGEASVIFLMNLISIVSSNKLSIAVVVVVFVVSITPVFVSIVLFIIYELPNTYKATLINIKRSDMIKKKYGRIAGVRNMLGLNVTGKLKSTDDIPVFLSKKEFVKSYTGKEDIEAKIEEISQAEETRARSIDPTKHVSKEKIVEFHIGTGMNEDVFSDKTDVNLPNNILKERVEYDATVITRILYACQFPCAFLFFAICMNRWFKGFENLQF